MVGNPSENFYPRTSRTRFLCYYGGTTERHPPPSLTGDPDMTTISFETVDVPTKTGEKNITTNPYWPVIDAIKDTDGKAAKFALPTQEGDDFKKSTGRARAKLNEISDHLSRTIRASFAESDGKIMATVWVMKTKITRAKKPTDAPAETSAETSTDAPADALSQALHDSTQDVVAGDAPAETPAETPATPTGRKGRRS